MADAPPIQFACPECGHPLRASREFAGRRSLCGACRSAVEIPTDTPERPSPAIDAAKGLPAAVATTRTSAWEAAYAQAVVALGADEVAVASAVRDRGATGGRMSSLPTMLAARGLVDHETSRRAMVMARRAIRGGGPVSSDEQFEECPNCFSFLSTRDRACPYCGQRRADDELLEMCPNCKAEQPGGQETCLACGADMRSGLLPIGRLAARGTAPQSLPAPAPTVRRARAGRTALLGSVLSYAALALLIAVVVGGIWALRHRDELVLGRSGAALNRSVIRFTEALRFGDKETLAALIDPAAGMSAESIASRLPAITGGDAGQEVLSIECKPPIVAGDSATVYAEVVLKRADATLSEEHATEALEQVNALTGRASTNARRLTWKWVRHGESWFYAGPLSP